MVLVCYLWVSDIILEIQRNILCDYPIYDVLLCS